MNIKEVAENLRVAIASKEQLLEEWKTVDEEEWIQAGVSYSAMSRMVEININELRNILADVEQCVGSDE